jgi:uncharacterized membrane protein
MKILGHPVHLVLVHFPTALLPMDLVCSILNVLWHREGLSEAAFFAAAGGVVTGWLAITTGLLDLVKVASDKPKSLRKALIHGTLNSCALIGYTVFALLDYLSYPDLQENSIGILISKAALVMIMFVGNYYGGSLVLKDGVGSHP